MYCLSSLAPLVGLLAVASAAFIDVKVGIDGLSYTPNVTTAAVGDFIVFHFYPGHHNVVQGDFSTPCSTTGGFFSGYIDSASGASTETFTVKINDTDPPWAYCSEIYHCQLGMAMVFNPPASGNTLSAYVAAAAKTTNSTTPANVAGGIIGQSNLSSSSSAGPASTSAPSPRSSASSSPSSTPPLSSAGRTGVSSTTSASTSAGSSGATNGVARMDSRELAMSGAIALLALLPFWIGLA